MAARSNRPPGQEILIMAKDNEHQELAAAIAAGVDPCTANRVGQTALHIAAIWGSIEAGTVLLNAKADVNAPNRMRGSTPLHCAAQRDQTAFAALLLQYGADPGQADTTGQVA